MRSLFIVILLCFIIPVYSQDFYKQLFYSGSSEIRYTDIDGIYSKVYLPDTDKKDIHFIIFSHGLGGNSEAAVYAANFWALNGYLVIVPTHTGSDSSIFKNKTTRLDRVVAFTDAANKKNAKKRVDDIKKILEYTKKNGLFDKYPLDFGMSGHSFGAKTTFSVSGVRSGFFSSYSRLDDIKAAIAFSPSPPDTDLLRSFLYKDVKIPFFHITGTEDCGIINNIFPKERLIPFFNMNKNEDYLLVFKGASHFIFSGRNQMPIDEDLIYKDIKKFTLAFWDMTLKKNEKAKKWLFKKLDQKRPEYDFSIRIKGKILKDGK